MKKSSSVADSNSATKGESLLPSIINVVPNLGDSWSLELNSDEEVYQETIDEFEQELIDPNKGQFHGYFSVTTI